MRIKSYENGGYKKKDDISSGGAMTGPLYLYGLPPEKDMEAITKQYVDSMFLPFLLTSLHLECCLFLVFQDLLETLLVLTVVMFCR